MLNTTEWLLYRKKRQIDRRWMDLISILCYYLTYLVYFKGYSFVMGYLMEGEQIADVDHMNKNVENKCIAIEEKH